MVLPFFICVHTQTHTQRCQCSVYLLTEDVWVDWPHTVCIKLPLLVMVYLYSLTMPRAVPVAERDLNLLTWRHTHTQSYDWDKIWFQSVSLFPHEKQTNKMKHSPTRRQPQMGHFVWLFEARLCLCIWCSLLIFSCLSSHSCRSSSLSRFSSSWEDREQENEVTEVNTKSGTTVNNKQTYKTVCQHSVFFTLKGIRTTLSPSICKWHQQQVSP